MQHNDTKNEIKTKFNKPIDLSLLLVCKGITSEARCSPFRANTIIFSSTNPYVRSSDPYHDITTRLAARFDQAITARNDIRAWLLNRLRSLITEEIRNATIHLFPTSKGLLEYLDQSSASFCRELQSAQNSYHLPSTHRDCITHLLRQISHEPYF